MNPPQAAIGGGTVIAMAQTASAKARGHVLNRQVFTTSRLSEFCSQKELVSQTGHPVEQWQLVVLKELVDNALDACEKAGIAPEIKVVVKAIPRPTGVAVNEHLKLDLDTAIPSSTCEQCGARFEPRTISGGKPNGFARWHADRPKAANADPNTRPNNTNKPTRSPTSSNSTTASSPAARHDPSRDRAAHIPRGKPRVARGGKLGTRIASCLAVGGRIMTRPAAAPDLARIALATKAMKKRHQPAIAGRIQER